MKPLLKYFLGIVAPLVFLLAMGITYEHLGLIIGSLMLGFEGLYVLYVLKKRRLRRSENDKSDP